MLHMALMVGFLVEQRLEPASSIESRLDVLVLTCPPDMLHKPGTVCHPSENGIDCDVGLLGCDLLRRRGKLDEVL
jgi:hypothetical protein